MFFIFFFLILNSAVVCEYGHMEISPQSFAYAEAAHYGALYDTSFDHNWGGLEYNFPSYPLVIGKGNTAILGNFFNGEIDDVAIWNRALSDSEITNLFVL